MFFITGQPGEPTFQIASLYRLSTGPSPAQEAGFRVGDRIVSVDGRTFANTGDQGDYIRSRPGQRLDVVVDRHGELVHLHPTPIDLSKVKVEGTDIGPLPTQPTGFIGIGYVQPLVRYGFLTSINKTGGAFVDIGARTFDALGNLVTRSWRALLRPDAAVAEGGRLGERHPLRLARRLRPHRQPGGQERRLAT